MRTTHRIVSNNVFAPPNPLSYNIDIRCTCGALLIANVSDRITIDTLIEAYDCHMIGVLDVVYIKQFLLGTPDASKS